MKRLLSVLLILISLAGQGICDELTLRMVDVGMAECLIISVDDEVMIVDTAYAKNAAEVNESLHEMNVTKIKYLVLTHPHADHISGAKQIIESYEIEAAILPPIESSTDVFNNTMRALEAERVQMLYPYVGDTYFLGPAQITVYAPHAVAYASLNNWSLVLMIEYGGRKILLTGDIEIEAEMDLLAASEQFTLKADILKIAHHGSNTSSSYSFIEAVSPDYAIISCGEDNKDYPDVETAMNLFECGVSDIWSTKVHGDITVIVDESGNVNIQSKRTKNTVE